jgi:hypothetical protein
MNPVALTRATGPGGAWDQMPSYSCLHSSCLDPQSWDDQARGQGQYSFVAYPDLISPIHHSPEGLLHGDKSVTRSPARSLSEQVLQR